METRRCIVFYDIRDAHRLRKVAKILQDYGERVQKSFFEADLDEAELEELRSRLSRVIDPAEDGVKIFRLCQACAGRRLSSGNAATAETPTSWKIV